MPFDYSCFISYRHGQRKLSERIVSDLEEALSEQLELTRNEKVFLDRDRLQGGAFYNEALSEAICKSACMVVVYTPTYFDREHSYCAREFHAMEKLEEKRLKLLGLNTDKNHGLIIPIAFRGVDDIPSSIKDRRLYFNFEKFEPRDPPLRKHRLYSSEIRKIADYIADRCKAFDKLGQDPFSGCQKFKLPDKDFIVNWLGELAPLQTPFVLRKGKK